MENFVLIAQILIALALTVLVAIQVQNSGAGGMFGNDTTVYHTRRGLEKTMFQATIVLTAIFFILSLVAVRLAG